MEIAYAILLLVILLGGAAAGWWVRGRLKDHHRSRESIDSVTLIVTMLVTFAALVLGLLVTSVKAEFDAHAAIYREYAVTLIGIDQRLRQYGPDADEARALLRTYTASVIAVTWPGEQRPTGVSGHDLRRTTDNTNETAELTALLTRIDDAMQRLTPADELHQRLASILRDEIQKAAGERWTLVEGSQSKLSVVFLAVLAAWLVIIFLIFGIVSPSNRLTIIVVALAAVVVASSLYLILDLDTPVGGLIVVSSQPMRDALWHIDQPRAD